MRISDWSSDVCSSDLQAWYLIQHAILTHPSAFLMTNQHSATLTYRDAGVDIDAGDALVDRIKPLAARTMRPGVLAGIGGLRAPFPVPGTYREPVTVFGPAAAGPNLPPAIEWNRPINGGAALLSMPTQTTHNKPFGKESVS